MKKSSKAKAGARTHNNCSIIRDRKTRHGTLDIKTGQTEYGPWKMETGACEAPLFSDREKQTGVCRSCASGYSVKGNSFHDDKERARALAA